MRIVPRKLPLLGQNVYSLHCKRNPQQAKFRYVAESANLLLFFDLLCCFGFCKQIPKSLYRSKLLEKKPISPAAKRKRFEANLFQIAAQEIGKNLSGRKKLKTCAIVVEQESWEIFGW